MLTEKYIYLVIKTEFQTSCPKASVILSPEGHQFSKCQAISSKKTWSSKSRIAWDVKSILHQPIQQQIHIQIQVSFAPLLTFATSMPKPCQTDICYHKLYTCCRNCCRHIRSKHILKYQTQREMLRSHLSRRHSAFSTQTSGRFLWQMRRRQPSIEHIVDARS